MLMSWNGSYVESSSETDALKNSIIEACKKSIGKVVEGTMGKFVQNQPSTEQTLASDENRVPSVSKHRLLIQSKDESVFDSNSWAGVVKSTISTKLQSVQVSKSVVTKKGEGCIILPDAKSRKAALELLKDDFNVKESDEAPLSTYPKLKISNIDTITYTNNNKTDLIEAIKRKCPVLNDMIAAAGNRFEVIFVSTSDRFAVIRVVESPGAFPQSQVELTDPRSI